MTIIVPGLRYTVKMKMKAQGAAYAAPEWLLLLLCYTVCVFVVLSADTTVVSGEFISPSPKQEWDEVPKEWKESKFWSTVLPDEDIASFPFFAHRNTTTLFGYSKISTPHVYPHSVSAFFHCPASYKSTMPPLSNEADDNEDKSEEVGPSPPLTRTAFREFLADALRWWEWKEVSKLPRFLHIDPPPPDTTHENNMAAMRFACSETSKVLLHDMEVLIRGMRVVGMPPLEYQKVLKKVYRLIYSEADWLWYAEKEKNDRRNRTKESEVRQTMKKMSHWLDVDVEQMMDYHLRHHLFLNDPALRTLFYKVLTEAREIHFSHFLRAIQLFPWLLVSLEDYGWSFSYHRHLLQKRISRFFEVDEEEDLEFASSFIQCVPQCQISQNEGYGNPAYCSCKEYKMYYESTCKNTNRYSFSSASLHSILFRSWRSAAPPSTLTDMIERVISFTSKLWKEVEEKVAADPTAIRPTVLPHVRVPSLVGPMLPVPTRDQVSLWLAQYHLHSFEKLDEVSKVKRYFTLSSSTPKQQAEMQPSVLHAVSYSHSLSWWHNFCCISEANSENCSDSFHFGLDICQNVCPIYRVIVRNNNSKQDVDGEKDNAFYFYLSDSRWNKWKSAMRLFYTSTFDVELYEDHHPNAYPHLLPTAVVFEYNKGKIIESKSIEVLDMPPGRSKLSVSSEPYCMGCALFSSAMDILPGVLSSVCSSMYSGIRRCSPLMLYFRVEVGVDTNRIIPAIGLYTRTYIPHRRLFYVPKTIGLEEENSLLFSSSKDTSRAPESTATLAVAEQFPITDFELYTFERSIFYAVDITSRDLAPSVRNALLILLDELRLSGSLLISGLTQTDAQFSHIYNEMLRQEKRNEHRYESFVDGLKNRNKSPTAEEKAPPKSGQRTNSKTKSPVHLFTMQSFLVELIQAHEARFLGLSPITATELSFMLAPSVSSKEPHSESVIVSSHSWRSGFLFLPYYVAQKAASFLSAQLHPFTVYISILVFYTIWTQL